MGKTMSTLMEINRPRCPESGTLQVEVRRCLTIEHRSRHPHGHVEQQIIHFPYDTMLRSPPGAPRHRRVGGARARTIQAALYCAATATPLVVWATVSESS